MFSHIDTLRSISKRFVIAEMTIERHRRPSSSVEDITIYK